MKIIARIKNGYHEKFGVPRQSGIVEGERSLVVFEKEYSVSEAFRGIEGYSHLWLIWGFSEVKKTDWSATVRPPRLGGNRRMGVFATRSPYRPNPIGLSSVRLLGTGKTKDGLIALEVSGADLMDGTPIYDVKPYLAYTDSHPDAKGGFADEVLGYGLSVNIPEEQLRAIPEEYRKILVGVLEGDPRPSYIDDAERIYTFAFYGMEISFKVDCGTLTVTDVRKRSNNGENQ